MSIFAKLALCVFFSIAITILMTLISVGDQMNRFIDRSEKDHFALLGKAVENSLEHSFREFLTDKVRLVIETRRQLKDMAEYTKLNLQNLERALPPSNERDQIISETLKIHERVYFNDARTVLTTTRKIQTVGIPEFSVNPKMKTGKKMPIDYIVKSLPQEGTYVLFADFSDPDKQTILFLLPLDDEDQNLDPQNRRILVSGIMLTALFKEAERIWHERLDINKWHLDKFKFYEHGSMLISDLTGNVILKRGANDFPKARLNELTQKAIGSSPFTEVINLDGTNYLCHTTWLEAYKSALIMTAPVNILRAPAKELVNYLFWIGLGLLLSAITISGIIVFKILAPLQRLKVCISELAAVNPASQESLTDMENMLKDRLDIRRKDELGDLARSFASMGEKLTNNIRTSMESLAITRRLEGELNAARDIQIGILPALDQGVLDGPFGIYAFLEPAREVGGDLYDYFTLKNGKKAIVLGDVSGKGVPAALFMTMCVTLIRFAMRLTLNPATAMTQVNNLLEENNKGNMFVTLFLGLYDPLTGELSYANGGHCPPYVINKNGTIRKLDQISGPIVGGLPDIDFTLYTDTLMAGEHCFIYSDGLTEALNKDQELYGEERLENFLRINANREPGDICQALFDDIRLFRGSEPQSDDITMLIFSRLGE